ncbi:alpha/beta hydrolase [Alicyclobacillus mengziensis]|uniref:Alpha/beta hydrolase n=1 Tax=Alicyclobacillus mengziensis TaxID=2931921 RepID=A0A9X7Z6M3_9BACL|nr:alpha/beta hydrolase [Alicyclobacillus mengziensis]QSO46415.1 alpha/beta hydrolase [Alicyclobacillus mengziensis]
MDFIHRLIPSEDEHSKTTLILLHGTGGNEEDLLPLGRFLAKDAALLGIRGKVLEDGMSRYFRRLAEGVFDEADLTFRTHELARFIEEATSAYNLNRDGLIAVGYSNGANIAASLLLLEPDILSAAVLFRSMVPLEPKDTPNLWGKGVLMQSGAFDPIIPPENSERLAQMLQQAGADVTLNWQQTGHGLTNEEFVVAQTWLRERTSV